MQIFLCKSAGTTELFISICATNEQEKQALRIAFRALQPHIPDLGFGITLNPDDVVIEFAIPRKDVLVK